MVYIEKMCIKYVLLSYVLLFIDNLYLMVIGTEVWKLENVLIFGWLVTPFLSVLQSFVNKTSYTDSQMLDKQIDSKRFQENSSF